ncbi:MAG: hypothetical protein K2L89_05765 [Muribaculaceae bacterium]|nr:hypothetical protein [Muribaculaceae bacterium]
MNDRTDMEDNNIDFVAKHYRKDAFSSEKALPRMGFAINRRWRHFRIAAVVVSIVTVTAVASIIIHNEYTSEKEVIEVLEQPVVKGDLTAVKVIDFDNASLPVVIEEIKKIYGVEVIGVPDNAESYHLSLHYEGNVTDLVETINEILELHLTLEQGPQ